MFSPLSPLQFKINEELKVGGVKHPTWILHVIKISVASPTQGDSILGAGEWKADETETLQQLNLRQIWLTPITSLTREPGSILQCPLWLEHGRLPWAFHHITNTGHY
jgi:hypothetical protein